MTHAYLDLHILQTVPPANLNRDDTGSPKTAVYGGARRARVSSQAWKRATRLAFADLLPPTELSSRTRRTVGLLAGRLQAAEPTMSTAAAQALAADAFRALGLNTATKKGEVTEQGQYLLFVGHDHLDEIVRRLQAALPGLPAGKDRAKALEALGLRAVLAGAQPADIALFGRMVADVKELNVDAACQVAHALSTHAVDTEFDYYTAVDDENLDDSGAGMIGTVEFASATLYRYAAVDLPRLAGNVGGDLGHTAEVARAFVEGFVRSMPAGKQTTFGHRTLPDLVWLAVRDDQPINLVGAFETPVAATGRGYVADSAAALAERAAALHALYGAPRAGMLSCLPDVATATATLGRSVPLTDAVRAAVTAGTDLLAGADRLVPA
jgi:CRISPR system Cascade subunit CasC